MMELLWVMEFSFAFFILQNYWPLFEALKISESEIKMSGGPYNYSYIFKYIIIGDMGVGKSCLLHQFTEKKCKDDI